MKYNKTTFWKFAHSEGRKSNKTINLQDTFLKWAARNSLKLIEAQNLWRKIYADAVTMIDADGNYYKGTPEDIKQIQDSGQPLEPITEEVTEQSDVTEEMRDAIQEKKEEQNEEEDSEQLTLMDSLAQEDEEETEPTETSGINPELPTELPPLPEGSV